MELQAPYFLKECPLLVDYFVDLLEEGGLTSARTA
jgi:hypothetical protein